MAQLIALSAESLIEITDQNSTRAINASPYLHIYSYANDLYLTESDGVFNGLSKATAREYQYVNDGLFTLLNPTPTFYGDISAPAQPYDDAQITNYLDPAPTGTVQFETWRLRFIQGFSLDSVNNPAFHFSAYVVLQDNTKVYLTSMTANYQTNIIRPSQITLVEGGKIYNTEITFEILDIQALFSASTTTSQYIIDELFKGERPQTIFFEYETMSTNYQEIDNLGEITRTLQKTNPLTSQTSVSGDDAIGASLNLILEDKNGYIEAKMSHAKFQVENYMNTFKEDFETFSVVYNITTYIIDNGDVVMLDSQSISNAIQIWKEIEFRPVIFLTENTTAIRFEVTATITNNNSGAIIERSTVLTLTNDLTKYDPRGENVEITFNTSTPIFNKNEKTINTVIAQSQTPQIVTLRKPIYVQTSQENSITLIPKDFTLSINTNNQLTNTTKTYLEIGSNIYQSEKTSKTTFKVTKAAHGSNESTYYLLDENKDVISYGDINYIN